MKLRNRLLILESIRNNGPMSRVELRENTELSWGSISSISRELIRGRVVTEVGAVKSGLGRSRVQLDLNRAHNLILGMQLGRSLVRAILVDIKGGVVGDLHIPVNSLGAPREILATMIGAATRIMSQHGVARSNVAGIGVAAPGAVDYESGVCLYAPHHPRWRNVPLKRNMERAIGAPCWIDHDYNCFALGEKFFGQGAGIKNYVCIYLGTGVSAAIVIGGEVYRGSESFAGEFGHTCIDARGPLCACGNKGCIETYISGPALAANAIRRIRKGNGSSTLLSLVGNDPSCITAEIMDNAARQGDSLSRRVFAEMGKVLGIGVSNLINIFNPQLVILGGLVCRASDFFLPACIQTVRMRAWDASLKRVTVSGLPHGALLGAAALVLQQLFTTGQIIHRKRSFNSG